MNGSGQDEYGYAHQRNPRSLVPVKARFDRRTAIVRCDACDWVGPWKDCGRRTQRGHYLNFTACPKCQSVSVFSYEEDQQKAVAVEDDNSERTALKNALQDKQMAEERALALEQEMMATQDHDALMTERLEKTQETLDEYKRENADMTERLEEIRSTIRSWARSLVVVTRERLEEAGITWRDEKSDG